MKNIKIFMLLIVAFGSVNLCSAWVSRLCKEQQEEVNENLRQAVKLDGLERAEIALDKGANPNYRLILGDVRSREMAELLIEHGADVNSVDNVYSYPLNMVRCVDIAQVLINHGVRPNDKDILGMTRLDTALSKQHREVAKLLIQIPGVECFSDKFVQSWQNNDYLMDKLKEMQKLYAELQEEIQKEQEESELLIQWSAVQGEKSYAKSRYLGNPDVTEQVKKLMHGFPKKQ